MTGEIRRRCNRRVGQRLSLHIVNCASKPIDGEFAHDTLVATLIVAFMIFCLPMDLL